VKRRVAEPRRRRNSVEEEFGVKVVLPEMTLLARLLDYSLLPLEDLHDVLLHRPDFFFAFTWMKKNVDLALQFKIGDPWIEVETHSFFQTPLSKFQIAFFFCGALRSGLILI